MLCDGSGETPADLRCAVGRGGGERRAGRSRGCCRNQTFGLSRRRCCGAVLCPIGEHFLLSAPNQVCFSCFFNAAGADFRLPARSVVGEHGGRPGKKDRKVEKSKNRNGERFPVASGRFPVGRRGIGTWDAGGGVGMPLCVSMEGQVWHPHSAGYHAGHGK